MSNVREGRRGDGVGFRRVSVIGPGLLGGSILRAVRSRGVASRTVLWARRESAAREALGLGVVDEAVRELAPAVCGSDLVVLCTPVGAMADLARRIGPFLDSDAIVTDVGSVKAPVVVAVAGALGERASRFVGSHPMAGSERSGIAASRDDLFEGATCLVTPEAGTPGEVRERVGAFWRALGGRVRELDPAMHDRVMARASHLPHLLASALVNYVCRARPDPLQFVGNGFRDTTRVASGPADPVVQPGGGARGCHRYDLRA